MSSNLAEPSKKVAIILAATIAFSSSAFALTPAESDIIALEFPGAPLSVPGDATFVAQHPGLPADSIEILAISGGVSSSGPTSLPNFQDVSLTKHFGGSTPNLFLTIAEGRTLPTAHISFYRQLASGGGWTMYYQIRLAAVVINSFSFADVETTSLTGAAENLSLNYAKIALHDVISGATVCYDRQMRVAGCSVP